MQDKNEKWSTLATPYAIVSTYEVPRYRVLTYGTSTGKGPIKQLVKTMSRAVVRRRTQLTALGCVAFAGLCASFPLVVKSRYVRCACLEPFQHFFALRPRCFSCLSCALFRPLPLLGSTHSLYALRHSRNKTTTGGRSAHLAGGCIDGESDHARAVHQQREPRCWT
jgi:hypothetical protein